MDDVKPSLAPSATHRKVVELFMSGRRDEALELIAPDAIDHRGGKIGDSHGREAWRQKWEQMGSESTAGLTIEQNVSQGDISVNRYKFRSVDPASGQLREADGIDMVRIRDGQIAEHWGLMGKATDR